MVTSKPNYSRPWQREIAKRLGLKQKDTTVANTIERGYTIEPRIGSKPLKSERTLESSELRITRWVEKADTTTIQDAWNLGWKLSLVAAGKADPSLLDSYEAERWPVGRALLRYTDRMFSVFTRTMSSSAVAAWARRNVVARVLPSVMRAEWVRGFAFRFISELGIRYRNSPIVLEGAPALHTGPRAGDRFPDARLTRNGRATTLHRELAASRLNLVLCGDADTWDRQVGAPASADARHARLVATNRLTRSSVPDALVDQSGETLARLGVRDAGVYLVRPDGYIAYRCAGHDLAELEAFLARWFPDRDIAPR